MLFDTPDQKKAHQAEKLRRQVEEYLNNGGEIGQAPIRRTLSSIPKDIRDGMEESRGRVNQKRKKEAQIAKQNAAIPEILDMHDQGWPIKEIVRGTGVNRAFVSRTLIQNDRDPDSNAGNASLSAEQISELKSMAGKGATASEAARWAGCSLTKAKAAANIHGFKFSGVTNGAEKAET